MATRRQWLVNEISALEEQVRKANEKISILTDELTGTPGDLLDRDPEATAAAEVERKNNFLRAQGLIPQ